MARNTTIIISILVIMALVIVGTSAYFLRQGELFTVTFNNSKNLRTGAKVYLAGIDIGDVKAVEFMNGNIYVKIQLSSKYKGKIPRDTIFFINTDCNNSVEKCILAKVSNPISNPIKDGDVLEGLDSAVVWRMSEFADQIRDSIDSPQVRNLIQKIEQFTKDFNESLKQIDWDKLGIDIRKQTQALVEDIDKAMQSKQVQRNLQEIEKKIISLKNATRNAGESEEARRLQEALEGLYNKIYEELNKQESN